MRVLLVDNDKVIRKLVGEMLARLGYEVKTAENGIDALTFFTTADAFDLVLTDINMPFMNGWQLSRRLKRINPNIPIIAITGEEPLGITDRIQDSAIQQALFKPFHLDALRETLDDAFHMARG